MDNIIQSSTLSAKVTEQLRIDILNKKFKVGEHISIKEVSEMYGVSPMPVREAFRVLEGERLLKVNAYKGAVIQELDLHFITDIYGILRALESLIYETAAENLSSKDIAELRSSNEMMRMIARDRTNINLYTTLDSNWHDSIISHGTNKLAIDRHSYYHNLILTMRKSLSPWDYSRIGDAVGEHDRILDALELHDKYAIKRAVDEHSVGALNNFLRHYNE